MCQPAGNQFILKSSSLLHRDGERINERLRSVPTLELFQVSVTARPGRQLATQGVLPIRFETERFEWIPGIFYGQIDSSPPQC